MLAFMVTVPVVEQSPPQFVNVEPVPAEAVSVTAVPEAYGSEQSAPQLIPAGLEVTVPEPVPDLVTERVKDCGFTVTITLSYPVAPLLSVAVKRKV